MGSGDGTLQRAFVTCVVACTARDCDCNRSQWSEQQESQGSLCLSDLRAFCLKPTWQSRGGPAFGKTVWGLWSHPGSWANEKRGSQGSPRVWWLERQPIRLGGASSRRGLRRQPRPGRLPATPGRVPDRGHRSGLVRLPKAPHPVPGPSEWRWGMPVQGARHPARGRFMEFSGSC